MIDFTSFFLGQTGLIIRDEAEAAELLEACEEDGIEIPCSADAYMIYPFWVIKNRELLLLKSYQEASEYVERISSFSTYAFNNQD